MQLKKGTYQRLSFTLIELLLVIIIIGALSAMVVPRFSGRSEEARRAVARADIDGNIATALKMFETDTGVFPATQEGLDALRVKPESSVGWKGPYVSRALKDPWGRAYQYQCPSAHDGDYDLYSLGKDGVESQDDIVNWEQEP